MGSQPIHVILYSGKNLYVSGKIMNRTDYLSFISL
jgi:hypothetical protein